MEIAAEWKSSGGVIFNAKNSAMRSFGILAERFFCAEPPIYWPYIVLKMPNHNQLSKLDG